jgi:hypothetical protein
VTFHGRRDDAPIGVAFQHTERPPALRPRFISHLKYLVYTHPGNASMAVLPPAKHDRGEDGSLEAFSGVNLSFTALHRSNRGYSAARYSKEPRAGHSILAADLWFAIR